MAENHNFNVNVAKLYGVNCALILQNIWFWVRHNEEIGANFFDGTYWVYQSTKTLEEIFPYLSKRKIETALKKLRDDGIIISGNYNNAKYDRTLWYSVTEKGKKLLLSEEKSDEKNVKSFSPFCEMDIPKNVNCNSQSCEMDVTKKGNGFHTGVTPIPDIEEDIEKDIRNKISTWGESEKNKKVPSPSPSSQRAPLRHKFGQYQNVLLSDDDLEKLREEFPLDYEERIDNLSGYIASTGRAYKNHLATIRNWAREDERRGMNRNGKRGNGSFKKQKLHVEEYNLGETLGY